MLISLDKWKIRTPNFFKYSEAFQECSLACFAGRDHLVPFGRESERKRLVFSVRRYHRLGQQAPFLGRAGGVTNRDALLF
jgi:hypothetical protein